MLLINVTVTALFPHLSRKRKYISHSEQLHFGFIPRYENTYRSQNTSYSFMIYFRGFRGTFAKIGC